MLEENGFPVTGVAATGENAIDMAERDRPNLILMDVRLSGDMDGIDAAARIQEAWNIPSIFLTGHSDQSLIERASRLHHLGYILKPINERQILAAVEMAVQTLKTQGPHTPSAANLEAAAEAADILKEHPAFSVFTPTEIKISCLIMQGQKSKRIAEALGLGIRTVEWHRRNIREKLGLVGRRDNLMIRLLSLLQ
jgi:DNA-binding NarL/FixJ family response regulator